MSFKQLCFPVATITGPLNCVVQYSGIFSREIFFANRRYIRPNGNFGGKFFVVPLKQSHAYLTRATLSSIVRGGFENKGVMSVSYTLESMILSNLSLLFGSAVKWSYTPAPAFLSRSSPVVWLSQLY